MTCDGFLKLRYSYGIKLLSRADTILSPPEDEEEGSVEECAPLLEDNPMLTSPPSSSATLAHDMDSDSLGPLKPLGPHLNFVPPRRNTAFYNSFPNSPNDSRANLAVYDYSSSATDTEEGDGEIVLPAQSQSKHRFHHCWHRIIRVGGILNNFMTVPLWSALLSLLVACIEPLKHALLVHMQPVDNAISTAGKCSVPLTLVVLGAYFHVPDERTTTPTRKRTFMQYMRHVFRRKEHAISPMTISREDRAKPGETKTVVLAVASRMIITPVLLIPAMALATRYDLQVVFQE